MSKIDTILNPSTPKKADVLRAFDVTVSCAEAIREVGQIHSGELYAIMMNFVDLQGYEAMIRTLVNAGLITKTNDLLKWVGPELAPSKAVL